MQILNPALAPPNVPRIGYDTFLSDAPAIRNLNDQLRELASHCKDFGCCVALFEHSNEAYRREINALRKQGQRPDYRKISVHEAWCRIGARSGALALRNYRETLKFIQSSAGKIESLRSGLDLKSVRTAKRRFEKFFPNVVTLRDSVAHPEAYNNPLQSEKMGTTDSIFHPSRPDIPVIANVGSQITVRDGIIGQQYTSTFNNTVVSYSVSTDSVLEFCGITSDVFNTFIPASWTTEPT